MSTRVISHVINKPQSYVHSGDHTVAWSAHPVICSLGWFQLHDQHTPMLHDQEAYPSLMSTQVIVATFKICAITTQPSQDCPKSQAIGTPPKVCKTAAIQKMKHHSNSVNRKLKLHSRQITMVCFTCSLRQFYPEWALHDSTLQDHPRNALDTKTL